MSLAPPHQAYETIHFNIPGVPIYALPSPTGRSTVPSEEPFSYWTPPQCALPGYPRREPRSHTQVYGPRHQNEAAGPIGAYDLLGPGAIGQERGQAYPTHFRNGGYSPQRRGPPRFGGRHAHDFASGHHNVVDVDRIGRGLDVRTTVSEYPFPQLHVTSNQACRSCYATFQTRLIR